MYKPGKTEKLGQNSEGAENVLFDKAFLLSLIVWKKSHSPKSSGSPKNWSVRLGKIISCDSEKYAASEISS